MIAENFKDAYEDNNIPKYGHFPSESYSIIDVKNTNYNEEESIHMHAIAFINHNSSKTVLRTIVKMKS